MDQPEDSFEADVVSLRQALRVAHALAASGRTLDLDGLDQAVGRLCAQALDAGPTCRGTRRPLLRTLLGDLDALDAALRGAETSFRVHSTC